MRLCSAPDAIADCLKQTPHPTRNTTYLPTQHGAEFLLYRAGSRGIYTKSHTPLETHTRAHTLHTQHDADFLLHRVGSEGQSITAGQEAAGGLPPIRALHTKLVEEGVCECC